MQVDNEIKSLTGIRGIAALYVVFFHYFLGVPHTNPVFTLVGHGYIAVDLFFVLSGFVMALNYSHLFHDRVFSGANYLKFLGRRFGRIYPLYLVTTCVGVAIAYNSGFAGTAHPLHIFIENLLLVQEWFATALGSSFNPPAWSISVEWLVYLVFPLVLLFTLFCPWIVAATCMMVSAIVLAYFGTADSPPSIRCLTEFSAGIVAFRIAAHLKSSGRPVPSWLPVGIAATIVGLLLINHTDLLLVMLFPALIVAIAADSDPVSRVLKHPSVLWLGTISYSLYLTHYLLLPLLDFLHREANKKLGLAHGQTYAALLGLTVCIPLSAVAYRYIEIPGRRGLRLLFEGKARQPVAIAAVIESG